MYGLDCICRRRRGIPLRQPCCDRDDRGPDAEEHAEDHGNPDFHRSCSRNRISVHAEYRFHPGVRKERTFHQYVKIPYSWVYGIAIVSYFDMIISYFYALFHGVKSEAKEAASSNE